MTSKKEWKGRYRSVEVDALRYFDDAAYERQRADKTECALRYLRHQLNQAIQTIDIGNVVPPGTLGTTQDRLILLNGERKAYMQVLSMLDAPVPPHFNPQVRNTYAEPKPPVEDEEDED